jgi:hypothetical protein
MDTCLRAVRVWRGWCRAGRGSDGGGVLVVTDTAGKQAGTAWLDKSGKPKGSSALFGLALSKDGRLFFVDDEIGIASTP